MRKAISIYHVWATGLLLLLTSQLTPAAVEISYYHTDALGSIVAKTSSNGELVWRQRYKPFGDTIDFVSKDNPIPEYTGKPYYDDVSLSYYGSRWYDRELGRFTGIDPVGWIENSTIHSLGRYTYVNNNPYTYVDPTGREPRGFTIGASGNLTVYSGGINGTILFDTTTFDLAWVNSTELGPGVSAPNPLFSADAFINYVWTADKASVFDFDNNSIVLSVSGNTSFSGLGGNFAATMPAGIDFKNGIATLNNVYQTGPWLYEAGLSVGIPGINVAATRGDSTVYNTPFIRHAANGSIDLINSIRNYFGYESISNIPSAADLGRTTPSAGGGL